MLVKTFGSAVFGVEAITITIEVNVSNGQGYSIVGLPDSSVRESLERTESAIKTNRFQMPRTKLVVNLAPADIRKTGAAFDLPIAVSVLAASEQITHPSRLKDFMIMGELGLDGSILSIRGALPIALQTKKEGFEGLIVPLANAREAAMVKGLKVYGVSHLKELVGFFKDRSTLDPMIVQENQEQFEGQYDTEMDFNDVKGQVTVKRALQIAAAGSHNAILIGSPGSGKTMLAKRMTTILPPLTMEEALETTRIHSVAGLLSGTNALVCKRPFRSPHHTISPIALVGGGTIPQPGEISLAHNGILFLDELPEFNRSVLEVMRQPMEERAVNISRTRISQQFPANFMLIASMNPCPCGFLRHPTKPCTCNNGAIPKYLNKISGPLLDRIDLHVEVQPLAFDEMNDPKARGESSQSIRKKVIDARAIQLERFKEIPGLFSNAQMNSKQLKKFCSIDADSVLMLKHAMHQLQLSARAYDRILKVSRSIADLAGSDEIQSEHIGEAIQFRSLDKNEWMG